MAVLVECPFVSLLILVLERNAQRFYVHCQQRPWRTFSLHSPTFTVWVPHPSGLLNVRPGNLSTSIAVVTAVSFCVSSLSLNLSTEFSPQTPQGMDICLMIKSESLLTIELASCNAVILCHWMARLTYSLTSCVNQLEIRSCSYVNLFADTDGVASGQSQSSK